MISLNGLNQVIVIEHNQKEQHYMLFKHSYSNNISTPDFIIKQLSFQHQVFKKIEKECHKNSDPQQTLQSVENKLFYEACAKANKQNIKKFTVFTQLLISKRQESLREEITKQCEGILKNAKDGNYDEYLSCVDKCESKGLQRNLKKDFEYLDGLRKQFLGE